MSNYLTYRGRCKELSEAAILADNTLTLVRGHYWCPISNRKEPHWWTVRTDGTVYDPSRLQFLSGGVGGDYIPFTGEVDCAQCGKVVKEEAATFEGNYAFCCGGCLLRFVGL